ncbi:MAG: type II toxin-antitoxin system RelE/ParE family toxin [Pseudomonas sp.]|uniref:type II toxin-antitoxin system RelE/ParE family toxin n=1 Tax=Pseudomonas putida TaxID=303 RepID=UPI0021F89F09|nr:type II toxin-antitoxin system RelE/ParE family toxin [Pseudomonas putida]HDS1816586.1 type II toxin-antitoxin system RelE/ParE family toxin [Pseudomonas putida]
MDAYKGVKPLYWVGSSKKDLQGAPRDVQDVFGFALYLAQEGGKHYQAKSLRGFAGAGVLEVVENHDSDTYRAIYTVNLGGAVYVLHCFQKKSSTGIKTPKHEVDLIKSRLKLAMAHAKGTKHD